MDLKDQLEAVLRAVEQPHEEKLPEMTMRPVGAESMVMIDPMTPAEPDKRSSERSNNGRDILSELRDSFSVGRGD